MPIRKDFLAYLTLLALAGVVFILYVTRSGICTISDSAFYIGGARQLLQGHGLSMLNGLGEAVPLTHFPPLFPALLALIGAFGIDPLIGARWLNALLSGMNVALVGLLIYRSTRGSKWASIFGALLILTSVHLLAIHWVALTEPLFLTLTLLTLFLLGRYLEKYGRLRLIAAASVAAAALLTRYSGAALIPTAIAAIFFLSKRKLNEKIKDSIIFGAVAFLPLILWFVRNLYVSGTMAKTKQLGFHPVTFDVLYDYLYKFSRMILPSGAAVVTIVAALSLLGVCVLLWMSKRERSTQRQFSTTSHLLIIFAVSYLSVVFLSISFLDALLAQDTARLLLPIYIVGVIVVVSLAHGLLQSVEKKGAHTLAVIFIAAFAASYAYAGASWVISNDSGEPEVVENVNFTSRFWTNSPAIQSIKSLPPNTLIYTNGVDAVYLLTGRPSFSLPFKSNPSVEKINEDYSSRMAQVKERLEQGGVLVYFRTHKFSNLPSTEELEQLLPLKLVMKDYVGAIYQSSGADKPSPE